MNRNSFLAEFRNTVNASVNEKARYEETGLAPRRELNSWTWTNPSLSLALRDNANSSIIENPEWYVGWDPRVEDEGLPKTFIWRE